MPTQEEKREESKTLLVNTALRLFSEKGYDATSIRAIAAAAGVSLGLMYNYFDSKEALLHEIFQRGNSDITASFKTPVPAGEKQSKLARHILQTVQIIKANSAFWRLLHSLRMQRTVVERVMADMKAQTVYIEAQIAQNFSECGYESPAVEAKLLFAAIDGMANHFLLLDDYPIDDIAALLIRKFSTPNA